MKKSSRGILLNVTKLAFTLSLFLFIQNREAISQDSTGTFWKPSPPNYEVVHALELESLAPMFFVGGFHAGIGYRYKKFRFRMSVIDGGTFNVDGQALNRGKTGYERYYTWSPGFFFGCNVWKNLEVYTYYENHTFKVKNLETLEERNIPSNDFGLALGYQFFIGRYFYIQPGLHSYIRAKAETEFTNGDIYKMPTMELTPVVRIGARVFSKFQNEL